MNSCLFRSYLFIIGLLVIPERGNLRSILFKSFQSYIFCLCSGCQAFPFTVLSVLYFQVFDKIFLFANEFCNEFINLAGFVLLNLFLFFKKPFHFLVKKVQLMLFIIKYAFFLTRLLPVPTNFLVIWFFNP